MKLRIGITQRVSTSFHGVPHDCLDQAWADLVLAMGYCPLPLPNLTGDKSAIEVYLTELDLAALILSGGNDIAGEGDIVGSEVSPRRDAFERAAIAWARRSGVPILGVCRGMQFLNVVLGGTLKRIEGHSGTTHAVSAITHNASGIFESLPESRVVNSFHNFAIEAADLAAGLSAVAVDTSGNIEAFVHDSEPIAGIMWHPERARPYEKVDMQIIAKLIAG